MPFPNYPAAGVDDGALHAAGMAATGSDPAAIDDVTDRRLRAASRAALEGGLLCDHCRGVGCPTCAGKGWRR